MGWGGEFVKIYTPVLSSFIYINFIIFILDNRPYFLVKNSIASLIKDFESGIFQFLNLRIFQHILVAIRGSVRGGRGRGEFTNVGDVCVGFCKFIPPPSSPSLVVPIMKRSNNLIINQYETIKK